MPLTQTALYRFLPLAEAVRVTGWTAERLQKGVEAGTIVAGMAEDGTLVIAVTPDDQPLQVAPSPQNGNGDDINARLSQIQREDFAHLEGELITLTEASREFGVPRGTLRDWLYRGYIRGVGKYPTRVNKADVAYCAAIYQVRKQFHSRAPLLDENGRPYLLKEPELARLRRLAKG